MMHTRMPHRSACCPRSSFPAPAFCAAKAATVESMAEGTRKRKLMIFSTMPTAAATSTPRLFAMAVMIRKEIWMSPS